MKTFCEVDVACDKVYGRSRTKVLVEIVEVLNHIRIVGDGDALIETKRDFRDQSATPAAKMDTKIAMTKVLIFLSSSLGA